MQTDNSASSSNLKAIARGYGPLATVKESASPDLRKSVTGTPFLKQSQSLSSQVILLLWGCYVIIYKCLFCLVNIFSSDSLKAADDSA